MMTEHEYTPVPTQDQVSVQIPPPQHQPQQPQQNVDNGANYYYPQPVQVQPQPVGNPLAYVHPHNRNYHNNRMRELRALLDTQTLKNMNLLRIFCSAELILALLSFFLVRSTIYMLILVLPDILGLVFLHKMYAPGLLVVFCGKAVTLFLLIFTFIEYFRYSQLALTIMLLVLMLVQVVIMTLCGKIRTKWMEAQRRLDSRTVEMSVHSSSVNTTPTYVQMPQQQQQLVYPPMPQYSYPVPYEQQQQPMPYMFSPQQVHVQQQHQQQPQYVPHPYFASPQQQQQQHQQQPSIPPYPAFTLTATTDSTLPTENNGNAAFSLQKD